MLSWDVSSVFFVSSVLLAAAPGPDNLFVLAQSMQYGRRAGVTVTLGLCSGILVHTLGVTLGVAAIFRSSELAFMLLKYFGAFYLLYLAYQAFTAGATEHGSTSSRQLSPGQLYGRGLIMNISNPKVSLFFLAFLPQFADPTRGSLAVQMILLGLIFVLATALVFVGISLTAGALGERLANSRRMQLVLDRLAGCVFVLLAVRLITN